MVNSHTGLVPGASGWEKVQLSKAKEEREAGASLERRLSGGLAWAERRPQGGSSCPALAGGVGQGKGMSTVGLVSHFPSRGKSEGL